MKVIYCLVNNILYAYLEDDTYTLYYDDNKWEPTFPIISSDLVKFISYEEASLIFKDNKPDDILINEYNKYVEKEEYYNNDTLLRFIDHFISFVKDDYINHFHNKDNSLIYHASLLDDHYNSGYISFLDIYYDEYLRRKDEFKHINIEKIDKDYLIIFDFTCK